jgi:hypothetical protein
VTALSGKVPPLRAKESLIPRYKLLRPSPFPARIHAATFGLKALSARKTNCSDPEKKRLAAHTYLAKRVREVVTKLPRPVVGRKPWE